MTGLLGRPVPGSVTRPRACSSWSDPPPRRQRTAAASRDRSGISCTEPSTGPASPISPLRPTATMASVSPTATSPLRSGVPRPTTNRPRPSFLTAAPSSWRSSAWLRHVRVMVAAADRLPRVPAGFGRARGSAPIPRPRFQHGHVAFLQNDLVLIGSDHPSQQNTQTGSVTDMMFQRSSQSRGTILMRIPAERPPTEVAEVTPEEDGHAHRRRGPGHPPRFRPHPLRN